MTRVKSRETYFLDNEDLLHAETEYVVTVTGKAVYLCSLFTQSPPQARVTL